MPGHSELNKLNNGTQTQHGFRLLKIKAGAPTDGTSGDIGFVYYYDTTNHVGYINTGTYLSPVWKAMLADAFASAVSFAGVLTPTGGIAPAGGFLASPRCCHTNGFGAMLSTDGTNLSVSATTIMYVCELAPVPFNATITGAAVFWGDATEGNAKVALFSVPSGSTTGTCVALSASTDVSGYTVDSYGSRIAFSAAYTAVGPATYYLGVICDSTSNRINTHVFGTCGAGEVTGLVYASFAVGGTITVPTTFTTGKGPIACIY